MAEHPPEINPCENIVDGQPCGSRDIEVEPMPGHFGPNRPGYRCVCRTCEFEGDIGHTEQQAIILWNGLEESGAEG